MSFTSYYPLQDNSAVKLATKVAAQMTLNGDQPIGNPILDPKDGIWTQMMGAGAILGSLDDVAALDAALTALTATVSGHTTTLASHTTSIGGHTTSISTLNGQVAAIDTWGAALATKLNADAGVTDTNYDVTPLT